MTSDTWTRRHDRHWPLRNRWLIVRVRWADATWRDRLADAWFLIRG